MDGTAPADRRGHFRERPCRAAAGFYQHRVSDKHNCATLGVLFVNISIGGTLTPVAAPPVLMVADIWNWDLRPMLLNFG